MKAVRCCNNTVTVQDVPFPSGEGVRVKVRSAGICGSDIHLLNSEFTPTATLGHEMAGIAENGQAVAIEPLAPCGTCDYCQSDNYHLCRRSYEGLLGVTRDGGMAEEIIVPARCLVPLPSGMPLADACLIEPLAVAVHGIRLSGVKTGARVAIIGGGSIGICALTVCRDQGLQTTLLARHDGQRAAAAALGATFEATSEYDLVIDCAGTESAVNRAIELCKPGGTLLLLATYWEGLNLNAIGLCMKEIRIVPASMYSKHGEIRDIDIAAKVLERNPALSTHMITHRFPLSAAAEAFSVATDRAGGAIKVVLEP